MELPESFYDDRCICPRFRAREIRVHARDCPMWLVTEQQREEHIQEAEVYGLNPAEVTPNQLRTLRLLIAASRATYSGEGWPILRMNGNRLQWRWDGDVAYYFIDRLGVPTRQYFA